MPWAAAAAVAGSVITGDASQSAADTQAQAANNATNAQQANWAQSRADVAPWLTAGKDSLATLIAGVNDGSLQPQVYTPFSMTEFQKSPEYQFIQGQDLEALNAAENRSSISGGMNSNNLRGLIDYTTQAASGDFNNALNNYITQFQTGNQVRQQQFANIGGISAQGLSAGLQQGQTGATVGQSIGQNIIGAGNARAAGTVGSANALTGAYNNYLQQQYLTGNGGGGAWWSGGGGSSPSGVSFDSGGYPAITIPQ